MKKKKHSLLCTLYLRINKYKQNDEMYYDRDLFLCRLCELELSEPDELGDVDRLLFLLFFSFFSFFIFLCSFFFFSCKKNRKTRIIYLHKKSPIKQFGECIEDVTFFNLSISTFGHAIGNRGGSRIPSTTSVFISSRLI